MVEYDSKQMKLVETNSSTVKVPYVEVHANASDYLNGLCTADLGPLDKFLSIYKSKTNKPIHVHTLVYIYIYIYIYIYTYIYVKFRLDQWKDYKKYISYYMSLSNTTS